MTPSRRISIRIRDPNPLFRMWITEWAIQADLRGRDVLGNSFRRALASLDKYPCPMARGRDCMILDGFGKNICDMLDKRLIKYRATQTKEPSSIPVKNTITPPSPGASTSAPAVKVKRPVKTKLPATVTELTQPQDDALLTVPSTSAVLTKKLRKTKSEQSLPKVPNLPSTISDSGDPSDPPASASPVKAGTKRKATTAVTAVLPEDVIMTPGIFEILLLVDSMETVGKNKRHMDTTLLELDKLKVNYEVRRLNIGDFTWIARDKRGHELILPYIVERKRLDDLAGSIKSGRYHEQKFRLRNSGIPNVTYLIEYLDVKNYGLPIQTLMKAVVNSEVHSDCQIKFTDSAKETMLYLSVQTTLLAELFGRKMLCSCAKEELTAIASDNLMHFEEFNMAASKWGAVQIKDFFVRQLIQLAQMSVEKALAIASVYPTPRALLNAYEGTKDATTGRALLSKITYGTAKRTIGPSLSKIIFDLYHTETPG